MSKSNEYLTDSVEVFKYPYCGKLIESEEFLSEKICCYTIKIRKKLFKKLRLIIVYGDLVLRLTTGIVPSQSIVFTAPPQTPAIVEFIHSNGDLSKQMPAEIDLTQKEMNELSHLSVEYKNNSLSQEELITKLINLRGGSFVDVAAGLAIIAAIILIANNSNGFQPNPHVNVPPDLQWLYGNQQPGNYFGYGKGAGLQSIRARGMTQNAGSDKKNPSSGSYNYIDVMKKLDKQSSNKSIEIRIDD